MSNYVLRKYQVEIINVDLAKLGLSEEWSDELVIELDKKELKLREALRFLQDMGDLDVSYENTKIYIEIISENAENVSLKVDNLITSYNNSVSSLPSAYQKLAELEAMLA